MSKGVVLSVAEMLESRQLFAVLSPDLSYVRPPVLTDPVPAGTQRFAVSGGKFLVLTDLNIPGTGGFDDPVDTQTIITRYNGNGTVDKTFGKQGSINLNDQHDMFGPNSTVTLVPGMRILNLREGYQYAQIHAYTLNGRVDTTFGTNGVLNVPYLRPSNATRTPTDFQISLAILRPDGSMLLENRFSYESTKGYRQLVQLVSLKANGQLDTSFGRRGYFTFDQTSKEVRLDYTDDSVYVRVLNYQEQPYGVVLYRYLLNGMTPDSSFGGAGQVVTQSYVDSFQYLDDGGIAYIDSGIVSGKYVLVRLKPDGTRDSQFGSQGQVVLDNPSFTRFGTGGVIQEDGQGNLIVLANQAIYRFNSAGTLSAYPLNGTAYYDDSFASVDGNGRVLAVSGQPYLVQSPQQIDAEGIVHIYGDNRAEVVRITDAGNGKLSVNVSGETRLFDTAAVKAFAMTLYGGNDDVKIDVNIPAKVYAGRGNDTIITSSANDEIYGESGNKTINAGAGRNLIQMGYDRLENATDLFRITTAPGAINSILIKSGSAILNLGSGKSVVNTTDESYNNQVNVAGGSNTVRLRGKGDRLVIGGNGINVVESIGQNQSVTTGAGADSITIYRDGGAYRSGGGNDTFKIFGFGSEASVPATINAEDGDDQLITDSPYSLPATIYGGNGNDSFAALGLSQRIYGEAGNDTINGGDGIDTIYGGDGDDVLIGGASSDRIYGQAGNDRLYGQNGNDKLYGGADNDRLFAQTGNDELFGEDGIDRLYADNNLGSYIMHGGAGNDLFFTQDSRADTLFGDDGLDSAEVDTVDVLDSIEQVA